jgi:very-short-patch-repair endonuclease
MKSGIAFARALRRRMTPEEVKLGVRLREWRPSRGYHFRRQAPVDGYVLDFVCKASKVIVEIDGSQHGDDLHRCMMLLAMRISPAKVIGSCGCGMQISIAIQMRQRKPC